MVNDAEQNLCPVCHVPAAVRERSDGGLDVDCQRCGGFTFGYSVQYDCPVRIWTEALGSLEPYSPSEPSVSPDVLRRAASFSHHLRRAERDGERTLISPKVATILRKFPIILTPWEQLETLVAWLGKNSIDFGDEVSVNPWNAGGRIGALRNSSVYALVDTLVEEKLATAKTADWGTESKYGVVTSGARLVRLSMSGWKMVEELRRARSIGSHAFMAMQFGVSELDKLVDEHMRPAVRNAGFELRRLDDRPEAGSIDDRLRVEIRNSRFLIADLTHDNNGAYWEAGFAEGLGKPVIYICKKSKFDKQKTHFDTNHHLTVLWDVNKPEEFVENLKATIRATLPEARQQDD